MATGCYPSDIIHAPKGREHERYANGDTGDIIRVIMEADAISDRTVNHSGLSCLKGATRYDTLRNVWSFVKHNNLYRADRGHQKVKTPAALFHSGTGDCKSYSISEAALLRALGFTGIRYRFAAYDNSPDFTHVYVVCRLNGRDVILDAVHTRFDDEVAYTRKKDIPATGSGIAGLPGAPAQVNGTIGNFITLAGLAVGGWLAYQLLK
jgi:hypothetical protein